LGDESGGDLAAVVVNPAQPHWFLSSSKGFSASPRSR
jgi:hypothetical protein